MSPNTLRIRQSMHLHALPDKEDWNDAVRDSLRNQLVVVSRRRGLFSKPMFGEILTNDNIIGSGATPNAKSSQACWQEPPGG